MTPRPIALVTGASGGIGAEIATELAGRRHDLLLVARGREAMESLGADLAARYGIAYWALEVDLAAPGGVARIEQALRDSGADIDILVNNAGFADYGPFVGSDPTTQQHMIAVNVTALTLLTRAVLPGMVARGRGRVLNVASSAAFVPGPLMSVYYATKAYVLSFSEALAEELRGTGLTVTALCPGMVATGFQERARLTGSRLVNQPPTPVLDARAVARAGVDGMMRGARIVLPGRSSKAVAVLPRLLPRWATPRLIRHVQRPSAA